MSEFVGVGRFLFGQHLRDKLTVGSSGGKLGELQR